jgi:hypothetical protein
MTQQNKDKARVRFSELDQTRASDLNLEFAALSLRAAQQQRT